MDFVRLIRKRLRDALERGDGATNIAMSGNIGERGHTTIVTSDGDTTIIERDGVREVIEHRRPERGGDTTG